jgi:hypothetical protein
MEIDKKYLINELDNIERIIMEINIVKDKEKKELVVIAGLASFLQNFYNGIENILRHILLAKDIIIEKSPTWHKDLLNSAVQSKILGKKLSKSIGEYLAFRHFFNHAYGFYLNEEELKPLLDDAKNILKQFKKEIICYTLL